MLARTAAENARDIQDVIRGLAVDDAAIAVLRAVKTAAGDDPNAVRQVLQDNNGLLGRVDLTDHINDETMLTNDATADIHALAVQQWHQLTIMKAIDELDGSDAAIAQLRAAVDAGHSGDDAASAQAFRGAVSNQLHLGNLDLSAHLADEVLLTNDATARILEAAEEKLGIHYVTKINEAIDLLDEANDEHLAQLQEVIAASQADYGGDEGARINAIRASLSNKTHLGNIDLTDYTDIGNLITTDQTTGLLAHIIAKHDALQALRDRHDGSSANKTLISTAIERLTADNLDVLLTIKNADADAVRQLLHVNRALLGGVDLTDHIDDEEVLENEDALSIQVQVVQRWHTLTFTKAINDLDGTEADQLTQLKAVVDAPDANHIRQQLDRKSKLGNVDLSAHINDQVFLTDISATNIQTLTAQKLGSFYVRNMKAAITALDGSDDAHLVQLQAVIDAARAAPNDAARDNAIRTNLSSKSHLGNIDLTGYTDNQTLITNAVANELLTAVKQKRNALTIKKAIKNLDGSNPEHLTQLREVMDASGHAAIRRHLSLKSHLGNVDFTGFEDAQDLLTTSEANTIQVLIKQKYNALTIQAAIKRLDGSDPAHLTQLQAVVDAGANANQIRTHLDRKSHLGNVNFAEHTADQQVLSDDDALKARELAELKLNALKVQQHVIGLETADAAQLASIQAVIDAPDYPAMRRAIHSQLLFGSLNLTGHEADETILTNADLDSIQKHFTQKRHELVIKAKVNGLDGSLPTHLTQLEDVVRARDPAEIRQALSGKSHLDDLDFTADPDSEDLLSNKAALEIQTLIRKKHNELQYKLLVDEAAFVADRPALRQTLQDNNDAVKGKIEALTGTETSERMLNDVQHATTEAELKMAMEKMGLPIADADNINNVLTENKENEYKDISIDQTEEHVKKASTINENFSKSYKMPLKERKKNDRYDSYLMAAMNKVEEAKLSLEPDKKELGKINEKVKEIRLDLLTYKKYLIQLKEDIAAVKTGEMTAAMVSALDPAYRENVTKGKTTDIEERLAVVERHIQTAEAILEKVHPILKTSYTATHYAYGRKGKGHTFAVAPETKYDAAVAKMRTELGLDGGGPPPDATRVIRTSGRESKATVKEEKVIFVSFDANLMGSEVPEPAKTGGIRIHDEDAGTAKLELYFADGVLEEFEREPRYPKSRMNFLGLTTTIPGSGACDWAAHYMSSLVPVTKQNSIFEIPGNLPQNCIEALLLYCKANEIKAIPPSNFETKITNAQVDLFKKWSKTHHPDEKSKVQMDEAAGKIHTIQPRR